MTRKNEEFKPLREGEVSMYVCGPTVYDLGHLGHGRSAISFDVMRRYFEYYGYNVNYVMNYTDIDDKMIKRAKERNITVKELALEIIPEYEKDFDALNIKVPSVRPKATDHISEIIDIVEILDKKGCVYVIPDDGVYFDISRFPSYGKLSGQNLSELQMGARVDVNEAKKNPQDFAVWKFKKEGEPSWPSRFGEGRPGWHIECSAMSRKHLGDSFDIHGGGADLIFPHHECEIAQSESALGKRKFAQIWVHNGFININNEKMSKSLGNFFTIREITEKYNPRAIRLLCIQTHYRSPINFADNLLESAKNSLERLYDFVGRLQKYDGSGNADISSILDNAKKKFTEGMDNDFDTPFALAALFEAIKEVNRMMDEKSISQDSAKKVLGLVNEMDSIFGLLATESKIPNDVLKMAEQRQEARKAKDFKKSDELRDKIKERGYVIEDTQGGFLLKKVL